MTEAERLPPEQHIDQDDRRYDGFRIRELWLATAIGPDDQEGPLGVGMESARRFHLPPGPAFAADERRLHHLREFAAACAKDFGSEVRIRHFVAGEDEVIKP